MWAERAGMAGSGLEVSDARETDATTDESGAGALPASSCDMAFSRITCSCHIRDSTRLRFSSELSACPSAACGSSRFASLSLGSAIRTLDVGLFVKK